MEKSSYDSDLSSRGWADSRSLVWSQSHGEVPLHRAKPQRPTWGGIHDPVAWRISQRSPGFDKFLWPLIWSGVHLKCCNCRLWDFREFVVWWNIWSWKCKVMLRLDVGMFCEILQCIGNCLDGSKETAGWYSLELPAHWINHQYDIIIYIQSFSSQTKKPNDIVAFFLHKALFVSFEDATSRNPNISAMFRRKGASFRFGAFPRLQCCPPSFGTCIFGAVGGTATSRLLTKWIGGICCRMGWKYVEDVLVVLCCFVVCSIDFSSFLSWFCQCACVFVCFHCHSSSQCVQTSRCPSKGKFAFKVRSFFPYITRIQL